MSDDAEFDAFLKGEGLLSRQLQAMPQGVPSAAMDAAILKRARELMAQQAQQARMPAANDAGALAPAPRMAGLSWRWRIPAGIAATVLAGVFAHQAFQASQDMENQTGMPAPAQEQVLILQPPAAAGRSAPPADLSVPVESAPPAVQIQSAPRVAPLPQLRAPAAPAAPQAAIPAADAGVAEERASETVQKVTVTGSAVRRSNAESAAPLTIIQAPDLARPPPPPTASAPAPTPAPAAAPAVSDKRAAPKAVQRQVEQNAQNVISAQEYAEAARASTTRYLAPRGPAQWLEEIEAMLGTGNNDELLEEWRRFRQAHPDYPVPNTTSERIRAIRK